MKISIGKLHHIGKRNQQQDSFGTVELQDKSVLAVVADGMGGLSDGDKVSQMIVFTVLNNAESVIQNDNNIPLYQLVGLANAAVNSDTERQTASGSTLLAVWQKMNQFQWIAVGDSRIYLYRGGSLLQLNQDHIYKRELLLSAINGETTYKAAVEDRQAECLTSYVGMGRLLHVEGSLKNEQMEPGDRIILMSDGVFNTLSEIEIARSISRGGSVEKAAELMLDEVLKKNNPYQDNFTAVILGWDYEGL